MELASQKPCKATQCISITVTQKRKNTIFHRGVISAPSDREPARFGRHLSLSVTFNPMCIIGTFQDSLPLSFCLAGHLLTSDREQTRWRRSGRTLRWQMLQPLNQRLPGHRYPARVGGEARARSMVDPPAVFLSGPCGSVRKRPKVGGNIGIERSHSLFFCLLGSLLSAATSVWPWKSNSLFWRKEIFAEAAAGPSSFMGIGCGDRNGLYKYSSAGTFYPNQSAF